MTGSANVSHPSASGAVAAALPSNEAQRLAALLEAEILDTDNEPTYDDLTTLAASICGTPIALISLVDAERQWFKSRVGLSAAETPRELSFCAHALLEDTTVFEVHDAAEDPRFAGNPMVTGSPAIRHYAGSPLLSAEGLPFGTICVIDRQPRKLDEYQKASLRALGRLASELINSGRRAALLRRELEGEVAERTAELTASESRYRQLSDNMPVVIFRCWDTPGWPMTYMSRATETVLGYPAKAFVEEGKLFATLVLEEDLPGLIAAVETQMSQGNLFVGEYRIRHGHGHICWMLVYAYRHQALDGRLYYEGTIADITERKDAERELAMRAEWLERGNIATRAARIAPFTWTVETDMVEAIALGAELHGLSHGEPYQSMAQFLARVHAEDKSALEQGIRDAVAQGKDSFVFEYRTVSVQGRVRWLRSAGQILRRPNETIITGATQDATMEIEIQRALEDRTREMERANAELDDFTYVASHDLKEPLRGIHNYARFIAEDYGDKLDASGQTMLSAISEQAERMQRLIEDLLHIARLGREPLKRVDTDLDKVLDEVIASLGFSLAEKKVDVRRTPLGRALCDSVRVGEVFRNLVTNALKYNNKPEPFVEIGVRRHEGRTEYFVRDNGIGIKPEFHARVFAPFKRLHAKNAFGGGTGVGLAIVRRIVEAHEGTVWVVSTPGAGATFAFTLSGE